MGDGHWKGLGDHLGQPNIGLVLHAADASEKFVPKLELKENLEIFL